ncbi:hypothetical protein D3C85_1442660 [compost metagenome]
MAIGVLRMSTVELSGNPSSISVRKAPAYAYQVVPVGPAANFTLTASVAIAVPQRQRALPRMADSVRITITLIIFLFSKVDICRTNPGTSRCPTAYKLPS